MQAKLTRREKEIFTLLLEGSVPKEIAGKLKISYDTVVTHQKKLYRKLNVHSIDELAEKYGNKKEEILSSANTKKQPFLPQNIFKRQYIIPAGIAVILIILVLIGINSATKKETASDTRIYLEDGTYFTGHTYDEIFLLANKYVNEEELNYGEQYYSRQQILLSKIYSGTFDDLIQNGILKLKLSGTVDKECKNMNLSIDYIYQNKWYGITYSDGNYFSAGPGYFSETIATIRHNFDTLPEGGYYILNLHNSLVRVSYPWVHEDTGERIPEDMPNSTIWATINNLKIEPVDRLAK